MVSQDPFNKKTLATLIVFNKQSWLYLLLCYCMGSQSGSYKPLPIQQNYNKWITTVSQAIEHYTKIKYLFYHSPSTSPPLPIVAGELLVTQKPKRHNANIVCRWRLLSLLLIISNIIWQFCYLSCIYTRGHILVSFE